MVNLHDRNLMILSLADPAHPTKVGEIDVTPFGQAANSVAVHKGIVAAAIEAEDKQAPGRVAFFSTAGVALGSVEVGALPDMLTFTSDGKKVVVANEGEPLDYCESGLAGDPEGTVSIIDISGGVTDLEPSDVRTVRFTPPASGVPAGIRIFGPNASFSQDVEPEYIAISPGGKIAYVTLQEANTIAVVDLVAAKVVDYWPLGEKDHSRRKNSIDPSDENGAIAFLNAPVKGFYMPDAVATWNQGGERFLVTANEGDARDYECFGEEERVGDLDLDPAVFPNAASLQDDEVLGRLRVTSAGADSDGDDLVDRLRSFGGRSITIWNQRGGVVWDSGNEIERRIAQLLPSHFNANSTDNDSMDSRSDDKGPEPEGLTLATIAGRRYVFVGLERVGGVMVFDLTDPHAPTFAGYANSRNFDGDPEDGHRGRPGAGRFGVHPRGAEPEQEEPIGDRERDQRFGGGVRGAGAVGATWMRDGSLGTTDAHPQRSGGPRRPQRSRQVPRRCGGETPRLRSGSDLLGRSRRVGAHGVRPECASTRTGRPAVAPQSVYRSNSPAMTFRPPSDTIASDSEPPFTRSGKVEKIGKQGGRTLMR